MDCRVPPRVTYWTGNWNPTRDAISSEIQALRQTLQPGSLVVSFAPAQRSALLWRERVLVLGAHRWMVYRTLSSLLEPLGDITHIFGGFDSWHPLRSLGRKPLLFTVAISGGALAPAVYERVTLFVAETEPLASELRAAGIGEERIRTIYPGVDLTRFTQSPLRSGGPFRLLFASTPADPREIESRGIPLLFDVARRCPDVEVVIPWRPWGDQAAARALLATLAPPPNVRIEWGDVPDMASLYREVHATVVCFAPGAGKSCPNSTVEGLACGRPALVTEASGIAGPIRAAAAGIVVPRTVDDVAAAIMALANEREAFSKAARQLAEDCFDVRRFCEAYRGLYQTLAGRA